MTEYGIENMPVLNSEEYANAQAEGLLKDLIEFDDNENLHLTENGVRCAFIKIRQQPEIDRLLYILLLLALQRAKESI